MTYYLQLITLFLCLQAHCQVFQTIRGRVTDNESQAPLPGASVTVLLDTVPIKGSAADAEGYYVVTGIPLGRVDLKVEYNGYLPTTIQALTIGSAKEVIANITLQESVEQLKEVIVQVADGKSGSLNEMSVVSARTFSVGETERYAGSRGDPARMASNFAGVQGANDSRNDIVIRGNSSMGLLYRLNDIDIPNPNHFAVAGTTGGPVSIINNKILATSDFITGAFPSEYGNAVAGIFDLKMRNGNNEKHEFTGQLGFLGTELTAEGPISKKARSSYLVNYRYSTLKLFESLKFRIGTAAVPNYQDASFKFNFPTKKSGVFSVFGIGGSSKIDIVLSTQKDTDAEIYGQKDRDQYFRSAMGVFGVSHALTINANTFSKLTLSVSAQRSTAWHVRFFKDPNDKLIDSLTKNQLGYQFQQTKLSLSYSINKKIGPRNTVRAGFFLDRYLFNFIDSNFSESSQTYIQRLDYNGGTYMLQPYIQWKHQWNEKLMVTAGLHYQHFMLNNSRSLEPRAGVLWKFMDKHSLSFGYGLHSQMQPGYLYFEVDAKQGGGRYNRNIGFSRSHHLVLSYNHSLSQWLRLKIESYYQYLFQVPVTRYASSYSLVNQGGTFTRLFPPPLVNKGTGSNYGIELTVEKFFSKGYYAMFTSSFYNSTYKGSDGIRRNTDFNGNFVLNLLGGTEHALGNKKRSILLLGGKITWAGGKRYGPIDTVASRDAQEIVYTDTERNTLRFRNYFRMDMKIGLKRNSRKAMHELGLDLVNLLGTKNILGLTYAPDPKHPSSNPSQVEYQLGFLPLFYYRIDF